MKEAADTAEFEAFADAHWSVVWEETLAPMREARGNPTWRPRSWMEGMGLQTKVSRTLRERFNARYRRRLRGNWRESQGEGVGAHYITVLLRARIGLALRG